MMTDEALQHFFFSLLYSRLFEGPFVSIQSTRFARVGVAVYWVV